MKLALQWFIEQHADWETLLQQAPYYITITRDEVCGRKLVLFKYSQIESDFNIGLVRECRGIILDEETLEPVCFPFTKFGNYGEKYCPEIDWKNCWTGQKLDGSLIKVVKLGDQLLISTNGTIDAFKAPIVEQIGCKASSFGELVLDALMANDKIRPTETHITASGDHYSHPDVKQALQTFAGMLDEGVTYMFELTSPFNKVVVQWHETKLNFLGCRDNKTMQETYFTDHPLKDVFNTPKVYPLKSIDDCIAAAAALDCTEEGFVVCDSNFNRVKVKSPTYVSLHHMRNNGVLSYERGVEIVRGNELDEVLNYFPEFKQHLEDIKARYDKLVNSLETSWDGFMTLVTPLATRKEQAIWIQKNFDVPGVGFALLDKKIGSVKEWARSVPAKNLVKALGYKE